MALLVSTVTNFNSNVQHVGRTPTEFLFDVSGPAGQTTADTTDDLLMIVPAGSILLKVRPFIVVGSTGGGVTSFTLKVLPVGGIIVTVWTDAAEGELFRNIGSSGIDPWLHVTGIALDSELILATTQATATATVGAKSRISVILMRAKHP